MNQTFGTLTTWHQVSSTVSCHAGLSAGAIVGIVIGALVVVFLIVASIWFRKNRKPMLVAPPLEAPTSPIKLPSCVPANQTEEIFAWDQSSGLMSSRASVSFVSNDRLSTFNNGTVRPCVAGYGTTGTYAPTVTLDIVASAEKPAAVSALTMQLDTMHKQSVILLHRYRLLDFSEQRSGSQGVVRFATLVTDPTKQFAVKFFLNRRDFDLEHALYSDSNVSHVLPPAVDISSNELEPLVLGRVLPPMIITERGESLDEWTRRCQPDYYMCLAIVGHLARRVNDIHRAGLVHRDLKPGNVMWLPSINGFTVIDFGSTVRVGKEAYISCTLAYAAPEAVVAYAAGGSRMLVTGALDVWSLGVVFYEFLTKFRVFDGGRDQIIATAAGQFFYPWERGDRYLSDMARLGLLRAVVLDMLTRDPVARITMMDVNSRLETLMQNDSTHTGTPPSWIRCRFPYPCLLFSGSSR